MGKALYRKYRSKSLDELAGQEHITATLKNALAKGHISHAYLLTGPRGVGKTSVARILAYAINDIPYEDGPTPLDIIEIDAASNRRIDEIRDLRDKVHILPTSAKYKVYIIDEVHMLTREAFNALLKTLEEPPEHVVFILATTEVQKLPETIISRTQHFAFKALNTPTLAKHLATIAKSEGITIDEAGLTLIAEHGNGSVRDSISFLDQLRSSGSKVTAADIERILGLVPMAAIDALTTALHDEQSALIVTTLADLYTRGINAHSLAGQLATRLRQDMLQNTALQSARTITLLQELLRVQASSFAERQLELVLLGHIFSSPPAISSPPAAAKPVQSLQQSVPKPVTTKPVTEKPPTAETIADDVVKPTPRPTSKPVPKEEESDDTPRLGEGDFDIAAWPKVLDAIKKQYNTVYGILRMAQPRMEEQNLILGFRFAFHQKQINQKKTRSLISTIIHQQTGARPTITCVVVDAIDTPVVAKKEAPATDIKNVSDIFGSAEVLES